MSSPFNVGFNFPSLVKCFRYFAFVLLLGIAGATDLQAQTCTPAGGFGTSTGAITTTAGDSSCFDSSFSIGDNVTISGLIIGNNYTVSTCGEANPSNNPAPYDSYIGIWNAGGTVFITESLGGSCGTGDDERVTFTATATSHLVILRNEACGTGFQLHDLCIVNEGPSAPSPEMDVKGNGVSIADGDVTTTFADHTEFGSVATCSGTIVRTFTIENTGAGTLTLTSSPRVQLTGTHAADFTVTSQPPATIASGGSATFQVTFNPSANGFRNATITIGNDDANENPYDFAIRGQGLADTQGPVITCLSNQTILANSSCQGIMPDFVTGMTITDNCGTVSTRSQTPTSGTNIGTPGSTVSVSIFARDDSFNSSTASNCFNVTVVSPEIDVLGNSTSIADGDVTPSAADDTDFGTVNVGNSQGHTFTVSNTGTAPLNLPTNAITFSGIDASMFAVSGITLPVTIPPSSSTTFVVTFSPTSTGVKNATVNIVNDDCDENPYNYAVRGTGLLACTAGSFTAPVSNQVVCPNATATFSTDTTGGGAALSLVWQISTNGGISWADLSNGAPYSGVNSLTLTVNPASLALNGNQYRCKGLYCALTDSAFSNAGTLVVEDNTAPVAVCQDITVVLDGSGNASITPADIDGGSTDNCGAPVLTASPTAFTCSDTGPNNVTLTATDLASNSSSCTAIVTVNDTTPPTLVCNNYTTYLDGSGNATITASDVGGGSTDNCGPPILTATPTSFTCSDIGPNSVTVTADDASGNGNRIVDIFQADLINLITGPCPGGHSQKPNNFNWGFDWVDTFNSVPQSLTIEVFYGLESVGSRGYFFNGSGLIGSISKPIESCPPTPVVRSLNVSTAFFNPGGTNTVLFQGQAGGIVGLSPNPAWGGAYARITMGFTNCTATVTVQDTVPPAAVCQDITVALNGTGTVTIAASDIDGGSTDNCGSPSLSASPTFFNCSNTGPNNVSLTVTDGSSNSASCIAVVTVQDTTSPVAVCQNITVALDGSGNATITGSDVDGGSTDNCSVTMLTVSPGSFDCGDRGANTVTLTATDASSNTSTCTATVTVEDNTAPTAICQDITIQLDGSGNASITGSDIDGGSSDNCSGLILTASPNTFNCSDVGANSVTLTATDSSGNSGSCTAFVTVQDTTPPVAVCQNITVILDGGGNASITASDVDGGSSDNCALAASSTVNPNSFTCANVGPNNVTLTVNDASGNTDTCTAVVTVSDTVPPNAVCQNITIALDGSGNASITAADVDGGSSDNCALAATSTVNPNSFTCSNIGGNTVTLTVSDLSGNTDTCQAIVTVNDTTPPTAVCQDITVVLDGSGNASITASDVNGGSSDNCGIASLSVSPSSFSCSNVGANTATLTVTDNSGNSATCTSNVTVSDTTPPTAVCQDITVFLDGSGNATITSSDVDGGSSDNCSIANSAVSPNSFNCSNVGANIATLTVTDASGNSATCTSNVTVNDSTPPSAVCQDITVTLDGSGNASITASDVDGGSNDNCSIAASSVSPSSFTCSDIGPNTATLTVIDPSSNTDTCQAIVTVNDTTPPTAVCQDITVVLDGSGNATITASDVDGGSSDNCGIATLSVSPSSFTCSDVGSNTATLTVTDNSGNSATCISNVTVSDTTPPTAVCQDITVFLDASGNATITSSDVDGGSSDNCGIATSTVSPNSFNCSNVGANIATLTLTDASGNSSTCTSNVTVNDSTPPTAVCQDITIQLDTAGVAGITSNDVDGGSSDNCAIATLSASPTSFTCADIGANNVTLTVTDSSSNSSTCTAIVTVEDNIPPTAVCQDITIQLDTAGTAAITANDVDGGSSDNCSIASLSASPTSFTCADLGANNVTLTVTDSSGNSSNCTAIVTVEDTIPPSAICQDITIQLDTAGTAFITAGDVDGGSSDNCAIASLSATPTLFTCADIGANNVILTVTDSSGNSSTCTSIVTVEDNIPPTAVCQDITIQLDTAGVAAITANDVDGGSSDNCAISTLSASPTSFSCADIGANNVTLTVTDSSSNSSTCTAIVTVEDNIPPTAVCQDITIQLDTAGTAAITANDVDGGSSDNCSIASQSASPTSFTCADLGANNVTLTVTDSSGNSSNCTAIVTVEDTIPPSAICQDITIHLDTAGTGFITAGDVDGGSSDNCAIASLSANPTLFTCADIGANNVLLTVTDSSGNSSTCTSIVTVEDNIPPTAVCQNITIQLDTAGVAGITANDVDGGSSDNCAIATLSASPTSFTCADIGSNSVTLTVTDSSSNSSTCVATVTVEDTIPPTALCQDITIQLDTAGTAAITANDVDGGSSDNCSIASLSASPTSFTCADLGANNVTLTVTDSSGNSATCVSLVTVEDTIPPTALCQNVTVQLDSTGNGSITANDVDGGSSDNCAIASLSASPNTFTCSDVGANTVTLTVTDSSGNSSTCTATATVEDNVPPTAVCQSDTAYLDASGMATITSADVDGGSSDACGIDSLVVSPNMFDCSNIGANTVTLTVVDVNANTDTCSAIVTVLDTVPPTPVCANDSVWLDSTGNGFITASDIDGGSTDNCAVSSIILSDSAFDCSNVGVPASSNDLFISEYIEGSSNNKCIEIYNGTGSTVNLGTYSLDRYTNGSATPSGSVTLSGTLADGDVFVICNPSSATAFLTQADQTSSVLNFNGDDAVVLLNGATQIDIFGKTGEDPGSAWTQGGNTTVNQTLVRNASVLDGNTDNLSGFPSLATEWTQFATDFSGDLGSHSVNSGGAVVTLTVTDSSGNSATCTASIAVFDTIPPSAVCQNDTVYLDSLGQGTISASDIDGGSSDACGIDTLSLDTTSFSCADAGANTVTLTAVDNNGNSATCTATVMVLDTVAPAMVCTSDTVYLDLSGNAMVMPSQVDGGSTDACGIDSLWVTPDMVDCSALDSTVVWLMASDSSGNLDSCMATVYVLDTIAPTVACGTDTIYLDSLGVANYSTANLGGGSDTITVNIFTDDFAGETSWELVDGNNNVLANVFPGSLSDFTQYTVPVAVTCGQSFTFRIFDSYGDGICCSYGNGNFDIELNGNSVGSGGAFGFVDSVNVNVACNFGTDNCSVDTAFLSQTVFGCTDVGLNSVLATAVDQSGNSGSCTVDLTVLDSIGPVITCLDTMVTIDSTGMTTIDETWVNGGVSDACGIDTLFLSQYVFTCLDSGANNVTFTAVDVNGNSSSCVSVVTVNPDSLVLTLSSPVLACGNNIACNGDTTGSASVSVSGACSPFTYLWSNGDTTAAISGLNAGTYTVTVSDLIGRTAIDSITLVEPAPLTTSIVADAYVCADDSTANIDLTVTGGQSCTAYTYNWSNGATIEDPAGLSHGTYFVTVTDTLGCVAFDTVSIASQPLPIVTLGPDQTKCAEDSVLLDAGGNFSTYMWSSGATNSMIFAGAGTHFVVVSDSFGCFNSDTVVITDYIVPDSIISANGSLELCEGDSVELMAFSGYQSYLWNTGATTQNIMVVDTGGDYSVIAIDANGCQVKDTITVIYNRFIDPLPVIQPGPEVNLCEGSTVTLDAGNGYFSYIWSNGATTQTIPVSASGIFSVTVSNGFGCVASSNIVTVTEVPLPVPTISKSNDTLFSDQSWSQYQWNLNGTALQNGNANFLLPQLAGSYSLTVLDSNGCEATSDTIFCNPVALEDALIELRGLEVYPNPTSGILNLRTLKPIDWNVTVTMTDMYGKVVKQYVMAHLVRETAFDLRDISVGMYVMEVVTEKGERATFRIVVE